MILQKTVNLPSFEDWKLILPNCRRLESSRWDNFHYKEFLKEYEKFNTNNQYNNFEALTINGEDLYYIKDTHDNKCFVESVLNNFTTKCFYDWYVIDKSLNYHHTWQEMKQFKKLNKFIWEILKEKKYNDDERI